jgi:hypothetical protein
LWAAYGRSVLWESAWEVGSGETKVKSLRALTQDEAMAIVSDPDFLPSMSVDQIGASLKKP